MNLRTLATLLLLTTALPSQAATSTTYGTGCRNLLLEMTPPVIGTDALFTVQNGSTLGVVGVGTTKMNLPIGGGCIIYTNVFWTIPYGTMGDPFGFPIPNNPGLIGLKFYAQAADTLKQSWSNGVEGMIGR